jgi:hypothetical protein
MELKEFISETIKQITDGVLEGNDYIKEKSNSNEGIRSQYTKIEFDIGVSSNSETKDELGGKISVINVLSIGGDTSNITSNKNENRIKFHLLASIKTHN